MTDNENLNEELAKKLGRLSAVYGKPTPAKPTALEPLPRLEDHVMIFHAGCGGIVTGKLGKLLKCAECGQEMTAFVSSAEEARIGE